MTTLKDIAQAAGVSESTASRALNGNARISKNTRENINKIAKKLNYHPNFSAKSLSRGESNIIGVIFPLALKKDKVIDAFNLEILRGINSALDSSDYKIMTILGRNKRTFLDQVKSLVQEVKVQNFILLYSQKDDEVIKYLRKHKLNFVIIGHAFHHERFVDNNNFEVGQIATKLILKNPQVKTPIFIRTKQKRPFEEEREAGYYQIMEQRNLKPQVLELDNDSKTDEYLKKETGIIFSDDMILLYFARKILKYNLPIISINNNEWVKLILDQSETIDLQPQLLGKKAVELLFNFDEHHYLVPYRIEGKRS